MNKFLVIRYRLKSNKEAEGVCIIDVTDTPSQLSPEEEVHHNKEIPLNGIEVIKSDVIKLPQGCTLTTKVEVNYEKLRNLRLEVGATEHYRSRLVDKLTPWDEWVKYPMSELKDWLDKFEEHNVDVTEDLEYLTTLWKVYYEAGGSNSFSICSSSMLVDEDGSNLYEFGLGNYAPILEYIEKVDGDIFSEYRICMESDDKTLYEDYEDVLNIDTILKNFRNNIRHFANALPFALVWLKIEKKARIKEAIKIAGQLEK